MISTPHDLLFKSTFSQPQHAVELFRSLLPPGVVRHIDFSTLQVEPTSFIDEKLRARYSDLLFSLQLAGRPAYLYLLFEHQSGPERMMCLRLLRYVLDIWSDHIKQHPRATHLPVVIPIVLHHGEGGWTEPVTLRDLYDAPPELLEELRPYLPELTFLLDDLAPQTDAALRARALTAIPMLVLWTFKHVRRGQDVIPALRQVTDLLSGVLGAPHGVDALATVMRYISEVSESSTEEIHELLVHTMLPQASEALMTNAEKLRGEGRQEGRKEGREETQRENLIRLLILRFGPLSDVIMARIRRADFTLMERWFERGVTASSLEAVFDDSP